MNIGFIGLGIMGSRMASNLQQGGQRLVLFNRTPDKASALVAGGALLAASPAEVGRQADTVVTMLAHPEAVEAAALGPDGFLAALRPGALWIDCSTGNPDFARRMAAAAAMRSIRFLDAPVAGSKGQAEDAQLVFLVGGAAEDVARAQPLLERMGRQVRHIGGHGMGTALKLVLNLLLASAMASFAEGLALGESLGLGQAALLDALIGGPVVAPFVAAKREKLASGRYDAEFPLRWMHKDLAMVAAAAAASGAATPIAAAASDLYRRAIERGLGDLDFSAIYRLSQAEQESGIGG
jgi:3-hydroxyisobutyrate dehydrogenase/glyoxylate/succinic semialdehyde reductase